MIAEEEDTNDREHFKKTVFCADIRPERLDLVIKHLMKLIKLSLAREGIKEAAAKIKRREKRQISPSSLLPEINRQHFTFYGSFQAVMNDLKTVNLSKLPVNVVR